MGNAGESGNDPERDAALEQKNDEQLASEEERYSCPKCGSQDVRRSSTEGFMPTLLRTLGRWPFRCRSCRTRFYRAAPPPEDD